MLRRHNKGHSLVELACVAGLLVIAALLALDVGVVVLGSSINERACRDAARAAAQASDYSTSLNIAQATMNAHKTNSLLLGQPTVTAGSFVYQDYSGNPPANTSPYVSVTTTMTVKLPAPLVFGGTSIGKGSAGTMTFSKTYTFPIVKTKLYLN